MLPKAKESNIKQQQQQQQHTYLAYILPYRHENATNSATMEERVRLATLQDLVDTVRIADDKLSLSQWNRFCHPRATEFPVESRRRTNNQLLEYLLDHRAIFSVAELLEDNRWKVVGYATWKLAEGQPARQVPPQGDHLWLPGESSFLPDIAVLWRGLMEL